MPNGLCLTWFQVAPGSAVNVTGDNDGDAPRGVVLYEDFAAKIRNPTAIVARTPHSNLTETGW